MNEPKFVDPKCPIRLNLVTPTKSNSPENVSKSSFLSLHKNKAKLQESACKFKLVNEIDI